MAEPSRIHSRIHCVSGGEAFALARWLNSSIERLVVVAQGDHEMEMMAQACDFFMPHQVITFPAWDVRPYDYLSPALPIMGRRIAARHRCMTSSQWVLITTLPALIQQMPPNHMLKPLEITPHKGTPSYDELRSWLLHAGYEAVETVYEVGAFALRGSIIDVFPPHHDYPLRADFFGAQLESLRHFDIHSQQTIANVTHASLTHSSEWIVNDDTVSLFKKNYHELPGGFPHGDAFYDDIDAGIKVLGGEHHLPLFYDDMSFLLDDLPRDTHVVMPASWQQQLKENFDDIARSHQERKRQWQQASSDEPVPRRPITPQKLYGTGESWQRSLERHTVSLMDGAGGDDTLPRPIVVEQDSLTNQLAQLKSMAAKRPILFAMTHEHSVRHFASLVRSMEESSLQEARHWHDIEAQTFWIAHCPVTCSMEDESLVVVSEQDLFGSKGMRHRSVRHKSKPQKAVPSFEQGALVVHEEHGVGIYQGLRTITIDEQPHDCLRLIYQEGDELTIPVGDIGLISAYGGHDGELDRLGSASWQRRKAQARKRIGELAHRLTQLAARRRQSKAPSLRCDDMRYEEFCAHFPFEPTEDQELVMAECEEDLAKSHPTDRLVCGDTGFGKTEVALRAAFIAYASGAQVMVLAPTTLLARQHYELFRQRMNPFGARVGLVSRYASNTKETLAAVASGDIHIAIGTHGLLRASPRHLGLLIVDEEQHFGVSQKERIKEIAHHVHVMTLTATPIPRTLHMAMSGLRAMSVIETPPPGRRAVRSFVMPYDAVVVRDALTREKQRGGASYYIVPRVRDIEDVQQQLQRLLPQLRIVVAHGRMKPREMDRAIVAFYGKRADVLLATPIVEAGLDVPHANTIIIHRSDLFGLAQLYQMRGRVGRSTQQGWAYLTLPLNTKLKDKAQQRLAILHGLNELGAGLTIAAHDRDLRGAGNLLGAEQSGHMREIGIELFDHMLRQAMKNMSQEGEDIQEPPPPTLHLSIPMLIPSSYISDLSLRLRLYRRLGDADEAELAQIMDEWRDRFGAPPPQLHLLCLAFRVRLKGWRLGMARIAASSHELAFVFHDDHPRHPEHMLSWIENNSQRVTLRSERAFAITGDWSEDEARLAAIMTLLDEWHRLMCE